MTSDNSSPTPDGTIPPLPTEDGAIIDNESEYRYRLTRTWDASEGAVAFLMLNPSTADAVEDDPTIRRCIGFAEDWGYGQLVVGNLFAAQSSDPDTLTDRDDPIGPRNDEYLRAIADAAEMVVAAWGTNGDLLGRDEAVMGLLDVPLYALDTTKHGHPNHPLYQPADQEPTLYHEPDA
jgi:hypothetical protein